MRRILKGAFKPPPGTPINWLNPLTRGLVFASFINDGGGSPKDLVQPVSNGTISGSVPWSPTSVGLGLSHSGSDSNFLDFGNPAKLQFTQASSFSIYVIATVGGGSGALRDIFRNDTGAGRFCYFRVNTSNFLNFGFGDRVGPSVGLAGATTVAVSIPRVRHFVGVRDVDTDSVQVYLDGILDGITTDTTTGTWTLGSSAWMSKLSTGGEPYNGNICAILVWNRSLNAREAQELYLDPWKLLVRSPIVWSPSATVTPPANTFAGARAIQINPFGVQMYGGR